MQPRDAQRRSTVLTIGIVFGTISPLMCLLTWIDFAICRICFGASRCIARGRGLTVRASASPSTVGRGIVGCTPKGSYGNAAF